MVHKYTTDGKKFTAKYDVDPKWQTITIPFADLKNGEVSFDATKRIQKIEFQPSTSQTGNALYLGAFRIRQNP